MTPEERAIRIATMLDCTRPRPSPRVVAAIREAENEALERAAQACEAEAKNYVCGSLQVGLATRMCALAIRALKHQEPTT